MRLTKKLEAEIKQVMDTYWNSYLEGDLKTWGSFLNDDYKNIGTNKEEIWHSKKAIIKYTKKVFSEAVGKVNLRNKKTEIIPYDPYIMVHELGDLYVKTDGGWIFYAPLRLTSLLENTDKGWKVLHQHGSYPDTKSEDGEAFGLNALKAENKKLKDAVERRTKELKEKNRELEIDTSLEKVRAVAMGMKKREDMLKICKTISQQLKQLGVKEIRNVQTAIFYPGQGTYMNYQYYAKSRKTLITDTVYTDHKVPRAFAAKMLKGKGQVSITHIEGKQKIRDWIRYQQGTNVFVDPWLHTSSSLHYYWYSLGPVALGISTYQRLSKEDEGLFQRFLNVFELAYRRYLDIEKAEAQAREAQIQLSLERVRSRSMAMHHSHEINDIVKLIYRELDKLKASNESTDIEIGLIDENTGIASIWAHFYLSDGTISTFKMPMNHFSVTRNEYKKWKSTAVEKRKEIFITSEFSQKQFKQFMKEAEALPELEEIFRPLKEADIKKWVTHNAYFSHGLLTLQGADHYSAETQEIQKRFARIFEQTYTRFLDLQKAEAQAREAKIEMALEKIRSRTMAMQHSDELPEAANLLFLEVQALGIPAWSCGYNVLAEDKKTSDCWMSSEGAIQEPFNLYFTEEASFIEWYNFIQSDEDFFVQELGGEALVQHYNYMRNIPLLGEVIKKLEGAGISLPTYQINHLCKYAYGFLLFITYEPVPDAHELFKRFTKVFEQTYTRFLDLQKAEAQARESQIQLSLERVRAKTMAMHKSEELINVIGAVFEQMKLLSFRIDAASISLNYKEDPFKYWMAVSGHPYPSEIRVPYKDIAVMNRLVNDAGAGNIAFNEVFDFDEKNEWVDHILKNTIVGQVDDERKKFMHESPGLSVSVCIAKSIALTAASYSLEYFSKDQIEIQKRFANVFEQAYTRFLDLQKAEAQAREAEIELALERVRARTMSMHKSEELAETASVLFHQLLELDVKPVAFGFIIMDEKTRSGEVFISADGTVIPHSFVLPYHGEPAQDKIFNSWKKKEPYVIVDLRGKRLETHLKFIAKNMPVFDMLEASGTTQPDRLALHMIHFRHGCLGINYPEPNEEVIPLLIRFAKVFEQTYTRFLDLQKAEAQSREAQIEVALERVRARTMAMHKSEELQDVASLLYKEFQELGVSPFLNCGYVEVDEENNTQHGWMTSPDGTFMEKFNLPLSGEPAFKARYDAWKKQEPIYHQVIGGAALVKHIEVASQHFGSKEVEKMVKSQFPDPTIFYCGNFSKGYLHLVTGNLLTAEEESLFERFTRAFEMTYKRFLDLQKAEAQARESEIQLALERVRARTMAMHNSNELGEVASVLFEQISLLTNTPDRFNIAIANEKDRTYDVWVTDQQGHKITKLFVAAADKSPVIAEAFEAWEKKEKFIVQDLYGEQLDEWIQYMGKEVGIPFDKSQVKDHRYINSVFFSHGFIGITTNESPDPETLKLIGRFSKVFQQTYTRFLDLQKAEAQARESKIQLSLERVRARSLAMKSSDELHEVLGVLFRQFDDLGIQPVNVFLSLFDREARTLTYRASGKSGKRIPGKQVVEVDSMEALKALYDKWLTDNSDTVEVIFYPKEVLPQLFGIFAETFAAMPEEDRMGPDDFPQGGYSMAGYTPFGYLGYDHQRQASEEEKDILSRICVEFSRVYQRFLDIQKAEKQAREAQIEMALERVRARSMGMHHTDELNDVLCVLLEQFDFLGINPVLTHLTLFDVANNKFSIRLTTSPTEKILVEQIIDIYAVEAWKVSFENWKKGDPDTVDCIDYPPEALPAVWEVMNEVMNALPEGHKIYPEDFPDGLYTTQGHCKYGFIGFNHTRRATEEERNIVSRFAIEFGRSYQRFLDIQKAEAQAREAQIESALEKVRSQSLAMHASSEMQLVANEVSNQLRGLGLELDVVGMSGTIHLEEGYDVWLGGADATKPLRIPFNDDTRVQREYNEVLKTRPPIFAKTYSGQVKKEYIDKLLTHGEFPEELKNKMINTTAFTTSIATTKNSGIQIVRYTPKPYTEEENVILKRFAKVFEQAYIRFMDLGKAEAQAREAQIEAALEKVRSRSLAMHKSEELGEVITVVVEKLKDLGFYTDDGVALITFTPGTKDLTEWMTNPGFAAASNFLLPHFDHPVLNNLWTAKDNGEEFVFKRFSPEESRSFHEHIFASSDFKNIAPEIKEYCLSANNYATSTAIQKNTAIFINDYSGKDLTEDEISILKRFAKVFEQAYIRFLDLQKAEAQAREAQIEAALERVRARAMAMHTSEELKEVSLELRKQMGLLGQKQLEVCGIHLYDEDEDFFESWGAMRPPGRENEIFQGTAKFPKSGIRIVDEMMQLYHSNKKDYVIVNDKEKAVEWFDFLKKYSPEVYEVIAKSIEGVPIENLIAYWALSDFSGGSMLMVTYTYPDQDSLNLLRRSANVFDLAYRRFKDLKKAEAQARENEIELSLERVRARTMAMHKSEELQEVIKLVYDQVVELRIKVDHAGFVVDYIPKGDWHFWIADQRDIPAMITHPYFDSIWAHQFDEAKQKGLDHFTTLLSFEEKNRFYEKLLSYVPDLPEESRDFYFNCPGFAATTVLNDDVSLYIENFSGKPYNDEENKILMRFGKVFQQTYTRFLDLQKAEAQAREAEIELGLERVRARTMAMQKSDELKEVVQTLSSEIKKLDVIFTRTSIVIYEPATLASTWWLSNPETNESFSLFVKYHELHPYLAHLQAWRERQRAWEYILKGEDKKLWDRFLFNETDLAYLPDQVKQDMQQNESVGLYCSFSNFGYLVLESKEAISADQYDVLYRFAKVFDLTYTRFLDIQKAESQARNAQIEASLERVRAKAMAMHNSEDIAATVDIFFKELKNLGITPIRCGVGQIDEETKTSNVSATTSSKQGDSYEVIGKLRLEGHPVLDEIFTHWKKQEEYYPMLRGEELTNYYKTMNPQVGFPDYPEDAVQYGSYFYFKEGLVFAWTEEKLSEEAIRIFRRFTSVIALTYRRYMDLKEAEVQAREALIDAALERIRGQAMAMRESNDLLDIVVTMRTEFVKLGHEAGYFWHMRWQPEKYEKAMTSGDGTRIGMVMELPRHIHGDIPLLANWEKSEESTVVYPMDAGAAIEYVDKMVSLGDFKQVDPNAPSHDDIRHIGGITFIMARTMHGEIGYSVTGVVTNPPQEAIDTLKRFADVFDLAYRRYEDLQKAEASTREAIKQAALDRIRADIASMRTIQDLDRITPLIWNELKILGIPFIRCGVFIMDDAEQLIHTFLSTPEGKAIAAFHLPYDTPGNIRKALDHWKKNENYISHWTRADFEGIADILVEQGAVTARDQYLGTLPAEGFHLHFLPFLQGMLYVGNTSRLSDEIIKLLQSVADTFSTAYARYEDFNKLEAAKKQVDHALNNLQEAQKQLIQSEKMASLGELTAGIAHEIQNPLNFVNNFSDVSNELIQEMKDELAKGNTEDALAIAEDVRQNLEKILHHGKRADGIVKGMLQHSRSSSGQKELTDINVLADEYLRLAFHGLRAKDKSFNAKFETHFEENIEKLNIVPQDIGRVILNLINNAFYAVNEKQNAKRLTQNAEGYEPTVVVSTKKVSPAGGGKGVEKIEVCVKDNGNGIPASVKEKIFQPFFTTKPTGQGTGLGLSLSYDIVKAHGGELKMETEQGAGTLFIINLPVQ